MKFIIELVYTRLVVKKTGKILKLLLETRTKLVFYFVPLVVTQLE